MNETHQDPLVAPGHEDQSARGERLVDYLYDELSPEARAAFEDELAADPALAAELAALRGARASFQALPVDPIDPVERMPRGLLDDVLLQADAQAATFAKAQVKAGAGAPGFFERAFEGLRRLVFQPAFAMGMVLIMVAGVALVATRNPSEIAGMEVARDVSRLPPVAMAPAEPRPEPAAQAASSARAEGLAAAPSSPEGKGAGEAEAALADLAAANTEPAPADGGQGKLKSAEREEAKEDQAARFVEARVKGDFDDYQPSRPEQPKAAKPVTAVAPMKENLAGLAEPSAPATAKDSGASWAQPGLGDAGPGAAAGGAAADAVATGASGGKASAAPSVAEASTAGSRSVPKAEAAPAPDAERARADSAREADADRAEKTDKKVSRDAPAEVAKAPARKGGIDDEVSEVPTAPPLPTNKPTEPAATGDRIHTTLKQQLAAGAIADAEKSLAELARLEGETTRVKQAREALARAKAAGQARPTDTKPLPEPAKTPR